ncbi:MAG: MAPEG family protein [Planctomycetota bacterium]
MEEFSSAIYALIALGGLLITQVLVNDVVGIAKKKTPGAIAKEDHATILFRAERVVANTNEVLGAFLVLLLACVFALANPDLTGYAAWAFVGTRFVFSICYYANWQRARSVSFGASLLSIVALFFVAIFG